MNHLAHSTSHSTPHPSDVILVSRAEQCRCTCGAMLARIVEEGLELKCRKCKSVVLISHDELAGMYRAYELRSPERIPALSER